VGERPRLRPAVRPGGPIARRRGAGGQRRALRRQGEPHPRRGTGRPGRLRPPWQGVRRLGDPPAPDARARLGDRAAGGAGHRRGGGRRHRVLHRQLPDQRLRGRRRDRGPPLARL
ncbi:MAG: Allantoicase, partial [uncultured Blastococcus sp.]